MIVDPPSARCLAPHFSRAPPAPAVEQLVQPLKTRSPPRARRRIDRWRQVRCHMRRLTRGLPRGRPASMLHTDFWLEALDGQHRYGFHLRAFHRTWAREMAHGAPLPADASFFHWLDWGRGRTVDLPECSQQTLRTTCVAYCTAAQRSDYEIEFALVPGGGDGPQQQMGVRYAASKRVAHTDDQSKWIFVLAVSGRLYLGRKRKGQFHHSSFVAGAPIVAAGKIVIAHGAIVAIEPHSGHFKPRLENLLALCAVLAHYGVDVDGVAFVKPKKWTCAWPFPVRPDVELRGLTGASDTDYCADRSDSDEAQPLLLLPVD